MGVRAIGRFEVVGEAGAGAGGTVYEAEDRAAGTRVAIKLMRGLSVGDAARFSREARLLAQIRHPGVVRYVEHGTTDEGHAYLVMEWLEGEDLRGRLLRTGLSIDESVALGTRVAEALAAVHAIGVVHRDVKPANIFLPGGMVGEAKIIDFGLVHTEWSSIDVTRTGTVVGTPTYMSPEQARGQRDIDARADVFSMGCVLFKCLTGVAPFEGRSVLAVLTKVLLDEAPRVRSLRPEVPPALGELVARMIHKDPARRPASAAAVVHALSLIAPVGDDDVEPAPPSRVAALTTGEQRVAAVLLVGASPAAPAERTVVTEWSLPGDQSLPTLPHADVPLRLASSISLASLVEAHGGQIDRLLDGTQVVTLATPGVATDQAARAARCALAIRALLPDAPMAIATGRTELQRRQTTGDAIERAAALLAAQVASPGPAAEIRVDEVTAALLGQRFDVVSERGALSLTGVCGEPGARTLLGRATPLVGREWEVGSIESIFRTAVDEGEARAVLVTGAAGMGKSRLAHEAVAALRRACPAVEVWWGRADALRAGSPLGLLAQVARGAVGAREGEPLDAQRRRFSDRIARAGLAPWVAELLGEIAGVPFPDEASPSLRAARRGARVMSESRRAAWEALVDAVAAARPLVLVLEDLQWADTATVRLVGSTLAVVSRRPWLVLAFARPEVHEAFPRLWEGDHLQEIRLAPLNRRAAERLAGIVLGDRASAETIERISAQADGNAFYLEELIRAVAEGRSRNAPTLPPAPDSKRAARIGAAVPETVVAMVQARLEALDAGTRRVLRAASVFGEVFWVGGVGALLGGSEPPGWADDLVQRELCARRAESRFSGQSELAFRHALLREGAYATLTESDRVLGHALAGAWLEGRGEGDAMVLAHHFEAAGDGARAARHHRAAAVAALRAADVEAAIACAGRACARAPSDEIRVECLSLLAEAHGWRDDQGRALACANEVKALTRPGSEPWIRALGVAQVAALMLGRVEELGGAVMELTTVDPAPGTAPVLAPALAITVFLLSMGAELRAAEAVLARLSAVVGAAGEQDPVLRAPLEIASSGVAGWARGDAWAALDHARRSLAAGEAARDARTTGFAHVFIGTSLWALGLHAEAEAELRLGAQRPGADADGLIASVASLYLTLVLVDRGSLDEARARAVHRIESGREHAEAFGALREGEGRWLLGEIAACEGDLEAAARELAASAEVLRPAALFWQIISARLIDVRRRRGETAAALALARELQGAFAAAGGHGLRGTLVRLSIAEALLASGAGEEARAALREARADLTSRAARIEDPAVRRRFLGAVPENARVLALSGEILGPSPALD